MLPFIGHPNNPDDAITILAQPDMRFFKQDCDPRAHWDPTVTLPPFADQVGNTSRPELSPGFVFPTSDPHEKAVATNREGLTPALAGADDSELALPTPELLDLLRYRVQARQWTEHNEEGQADFIWVCYNTSPCLQEPDDGNFLRDFASKDDLKKYMKSKPNDARKSAVQAGDILIMMTARFARKMLAVIVGLSCVSCSSQVLQSSPSSYSFML